MGQIKVLRDQQAIIQIFRKWQLSEQGILAVYYYCQVNNNVAILGDPTRYLLEPISSYRTSQLIQQSLFS